MKSLSVLPIPVSAAGTFDCSLHTNSRPEAPDEFISVRKNGLPWTGELEAHLNKATATLTLLGVASHKDEEVLVMKLKFEGIGTYSLTKQQAYCYTTADGHVLTSAYGLAPCTAGMLEISGYDAAEKFMEGSFRLMLTKEQTDPENAAETMTFSEGKFRGRVTF